MPTKVDSMSKFLAVVPILLAVCFAPRSPAGEHLSPSGARETREGRDARMRWWREARFTDR